MSTQPTVADIFRRAQSLWRENPNLSLKDLKQRLLEEYRGSPFPPADKLAIPEQDARAPEEDWSAGLAIALRGIQRQDWSEIIDGILMSLEQTERYERERGPLGSADRWHDRSKGIRTALEQGLSKWLPAELLAAAERAGRKER
ncbi:hypothetical protein [Pyrinomonas methylaliphatogenes]|jgi:hypothetical protein|uniref:Uncharacterized protein n=1 Tax=Pyrinomonas methylaliphatogenes TaxID=454194 RepID=A0A0B6X1W7_9BACT|nr:hypothetical protein [Pyrinomonas methylaliphatogenes]CDM66534.1 hypothetical protein PYK22_02565 [Pyrinomonas methylaliphatogenes]